MSRRSLHLAALTLALAFAAPMAMAESPRGPMGHHGPPPPTGIVLHALEDIDLDDAQVAELEALKASFEATRPERPERPERMERSERMERPSSEERAAHHARRQEGAERLESELLKATPDAEQLHALLDDNPHGEAPPEAHDHLDQLLAFHATLTDGQRSQLVEEMVEGRESHRMRRDKRSRGDCSDEGAAGDRSER